jgi:hypothetical protein
MKRPSPVVDIDDTVLRRLNALERLIDAEYEGKPKVFQDKTGIKMAQVGQWFTGYRALRDKALKRLEFETRKPSGWFDQDYQAESTYLDEAARRLGMPPVKLNPPNQPLAPIERAQAAINSVATLEQAIGVLDGYMAQLDAGKRGAVAALLAAMTQNPGDPAIAAALTALLAPEVFTQLEKRQA